MSEDFLRFLAARAAEQGFQPDAAQLAAARELQRVHDELDRGQQRRGLLSFLGRNRSVRGVYLWGGVGRGKSFLMDSFFAFVPDVSKKRIHFHRFMQEIHKALARHQGNAEPMSLVARDIAREARILCLDEFHVTDITDAMLMRRLLEGLMAEGVVLLTTSNFEPKELYQHGLQRVQFLPAIDLIYERMGVVNVDAGTDYRLRELEKAGTYHVGPDVDRHLGDAFVHIASGPGDDAALDIEDRLIRVRRQAPGIAWFDFAELCAGPRGKPDYIELSKRYHTVIITGVPQFGADDGDVLRRFVWLVDEFYDRRVKLMIGAAVAADDLVAAARDEDGFLAHLNASLKERLASRLTEMQTHHYLAQPHLP
ncbi:MAG: cell division protein ZapE [Betaproteobacteria bacterium]